MKANRQILEWATKAAVSSYFPLREDCFEGDPKKGILKPMYAGSIEDYSFFIEGTIEKFQNQNARGFFALQDNPTYGKCLWIVHTGSNDNKDWQENFDFIQEKSDLNDEPYGGKTSTGIAIHSGFLEHFRLVKDIVEKKIQQCIDMDIKKFIICGHSLGAASSILDSANAQYKWGDAIDILNIPLASPRLFNRAGQISFDKRVPDCYRVIAGTDVVPTLPPEGWGYSDVAQKHEIHIGFDDFWGNVSFFNWFPKITSYIPVLRIFGIFVNAITAPDHAPMKYVRDMKSFPDDKLNKILAV